MNAAQARQFAVLDRMRRLFETGMRRASAAQVSREIKKATKAYMSDGLHGADISIGEEQMQEWYRILIRNSARVGRTFGTYVFDSLGIKSLTLVEFKVDAVAGAGAGAGTAWSTAEGIAFEAALTEWIQTEGLKRAKTIVGTSKAVIRELLIALEEEGLGVEAIGRRVRGLAPSIGAHRSRVIAKTEIHNAASWAGQEAARSTDIELAKKWLASPDERTRDTHDTAGAGDPIALDEPYDVGDFQMMYPGDSSLGAPAEETIQCRCSEAYTPIK